MTAQPNSVPLVSGRLTGAALGWKVGLLAAWLIYAGAAVWGIGMVPFHPDESTYLYMSRDFDLLFVEGQPAGVSWQAESQPAAVRRYRLLDAPMARYLNGLGRALAGQGPLTQDWNWSESWRANVAAGALPNDRALNAARLPATLLTTLSVLLVYGIGERLGGRWTGLGAALLYALSGLVLLHGRRAMSEGHMLFFDLLTVWLLVRPRVNPIQVGVALAAAIAAKLTGLALLPVAMLACLLPVGGLRPALPWRHAAARLLALGLSCLLALWALHPAQWFSPVAGLQAMRLARQGFLAEQSAFMEAVAPHWRLDQPGERALAIVYHVYFAPLAFAEAGNYSADTLASEQRYAALSLHVGWHRGGLVAGAAVLALTLLGIFLGGFPAWTRRRADNVSPGFPQASDRRTFGLLALWIMATVTVLLAIAVPAQRYYLPLVPGVCVWAAHGLVSLIRPLASVARPLPPAQTASHD